MNSKEEIVITLSGCVLGAIRYSVLAAAVAGCMVAADPETASAPIGWAARSRPWAGPEQPAVGMVMWLSRAPRRH